MRRVERWIFAPGDARRLAALRIGLCMLVAYRLASNDYDAVAARHVHFLPHFYMDVFGGMPSPDVATTLQTVGIACALAAAAGLLLRMTLPTAFLCALYLNGMVNSAGRVMVRDALLILCLALLVATGRASGDAWSVRMRNRAPFGERYGWPVRTAMIVIVLAYFFAGVQKWRYSGFAWVTSDNLRWILYGQAHPDGFALYVADRPLLAHAFAAGALLLETCFPLVLFVPRLRWIFIPAAVGMHVAIRVALGLDYSAQWLTTVIVFVNWPVIVDWVRGVTSPVLTARESAG
jgi:hypothetical protein